MYSIVIPIYNVELYILDCLEAIKNQSFKDFECILVDDGSLDQSGMIAKKFSLADDRFKYFHKNNGGLSDARNFGLEKATGDYIIFVDSDDIIRPDLLKKVDQLSNSVEADLILIDFFKFSKEYFFDSTENDCHFECLDKKQLAKKPNYSWMRIAKRELYDDLRFPVGYLYEDVYLSPLLCERANSIYALSHKLYGYRSRENSITTSSKLNQLQSIDVINKLVFEYPALVNKEHFKVMYIYLSWSIIVNICRQTKIRIVFKYVDEFSKQLNRFSINEYLDRNISFKMRAVLYPFIVGRKCSFLFIALFKPIVIAYDLFLK